MAIRRTARSKLIERAPEHMCKYCINLYNFAFLTAKITIVKWLKFFDSQNQKKRYAKLCTAHTSFACSQSDFATRTNYKQTHDRTHEWKKWAHYVFLFRANTKKRLKWKETRDMIKCRCFIHNSCFKWFIACLCVSVVLLFFFFQESLSVERNIQLHGRTKMINEQRRLCNGVKSLV